VELLFACKAYIGQTVIIGVVICIACTALDSLEVRGKQVFLLFNKSIPYFIALRQTLDKVAVDAIIKHHSLRLRTQSPSVRRLC
jgi:hypothetical protein